MAGPVERPHLNPLGETTRHSTRPKTTSAKSLVIPQAGEEATVKTLVLDEQDLHLLPPSVRRLVDDIGLTAALLVVEWYGGTWIVIPGKVTGNPDLHARIGHEAFGKLVAKYPHTRIEIPRCLKAMRQIIHRKIRADALAGICQTELARRYRYTVRNIRKIEMRGEPEEDLNGKLF